jgi:hypothetical protein
MSDSGAVSCTTLKRVYLIGIIPETPNICSNIAPLAPLFTNFPIGKPIFLKNECSRKGVQSGASGADNNALLGR